MPGGGRSMATGPIETHLHRSFNWENGAPGPQEGPRGRSANCGNGLFAQCVRLRSEINPFLHLETKRRPGPERRSNNLGGRSLPIGKLVPEHIPNEHTRADAFQIPPATLGKANTICKLAAILAITRNDLDQTVRIQALNCGAGSIRRHPNVLRKRFAREAICPATFGLLGNLHQHQHFDTLHIVDTRTTLARHGSLL